MRRKKCKQEFFRNFGFLVSSGLRLCSNHEDTSLKIKPGHRNTSRIPSFKTSESCHYQRKHIDSTLEVKSCDRWDLLYSHCFLYISGSPENTIYVNCLIVPFFGLYYFLHAFYSRGCNQYGDDTSWSPRTAEHLQWLAVQFEKALILSGTLGSSKVSIGVTV